MQLVFLPVDIYTLVTSAMKLNSHGKEEPQAVKKLRDLADELEREMIEMLKVVLLETLEKRRLEPCE